MMKFAIEHGNLLYRCRNSYCNLKVESLKHVKMKYILRKGTIGCENYSGKGAIKSIKTILIHAIKNIS